MNSQTYEILKKLGYSYSQKIEDDLPSLWDIMKWLRDSELAPP